MATEQRNNWIDEETNNEINSSSNNAEILLYCCFCDSIPPLPALVDYLGNSLG